MTRGWMTSCTGSVCGGFRGFEESELVEFKRPNGRVEFLPRKKTVDFRSSPRPCGGCGTWFETDGKVVIERLCLSFPHVEKPFNSKVIKSFVPELRCRKCFSCFGIPMLSICALWTLWTFCVPVWICLFHVSTSGYVTIQCLLKINIAITHETFTCLNELWTISIHDF